MPRRESPPPPARESGRPRSGPARSGPDALSGAVGALVKRLENMDLETDDLMMALILYLMYRESGDKDLLVMLGAMFL